MEKSFSRKDDHIKLALSEYEKPSFDAGFDKYRFEHNALPEIDFSEIDTSVKFLGRKLNLPLIVSSMTGGGAISQKINRALAEMANDFNIGFAVGSQTCAINDNDFEKTFKVRIHAPNTLIFANIGAVQLNYGFSIDECKKAIDMIDADALILHLNPLQEVFQYEGTKNFSCLLKKIEAVCSKSRVPVIAKEIGYGISLSVARKLYDAGVYAVEIAGAGSISWSEIEKQRSNDIVIKNAAKSFLNWGNPTVECLQAISEGIKGIKIISSGGIKTGVHIAKSISLGADLCGNASDFLRCAIESRAECENFIETLSLELKIAMFCTGSKNIEQLKKIKLIKN